MSDSMEVHKLADSDKYKVIVEDDRAPFVWMGIGFIKKDHEGYYRFHPNDDIDMTCKQLRTLAVHVGELN